MHMYFSRVDSYTGNKYICLPDHYMGDMTKAWQRKAFFFMNMCEHLFYLLTRL